MPFQNLEAFAATDAPCTPSNSSTCTWVKHQHQQVGVRLFMILLFMLVTFSNWNIFLCLVGETHVALAVSSRWRIFVDACVHRNTFNHNGLLLDTLQVHVGTSNHVGKRWSVYVVFSSDHNHSSIPGFK